MPGRRGSSPTAESWTGGMDDIARGDVGTSDQGPGDVYPGDPVTDRTGELPHHDAAHVDGIETSEKAPIALGEA